MLNGLYSASSAMEAATKRHDFIAQNLAHAQMPGYRRQMVMHSSKESQFEDDLKNAVLFENQGVNADKVTIDFSPGVMERTNHPLDMAIQGDGFFVVEGPDGPLYTRNGTFHLDAEGRLVTSDQLPVQGKGGEIRLPPNASVSNLQVGQDGRITLNGNELGQLDIVEFENPQKLQHAGVTLFTAPDDLPPQESSSTVLQNTREHANVSPILELVDLIAAQRQQEAAQRSMSLLTESVSKNINLQGR